METNRIEDPRRAANRTASPTPSRRGEGEATTLLARLADLAYRRRGRVVLAWVVILVAVLVFGSQLAGEYKEDYSTPGSESKAAAALLAERFGGVSADTIDVVWQAPGGVREPAVAARMERFLDEAAELEGVGSVAGPSEISRDGTIAVARATRRRPGRDRMTGYPLLTLLEVDHGSTEDE